jgi:hypothetical protein
MGGKRTLVKRGTTGQKRTPMSVREGDRVQREHPLTNVAASEAPAYSEHRFFVGSLIAAFAIVFAGFARTYYLKGLFGTPELPWRLHLHGLVMTLWFALFLTQVCLVATGRITRHMRLGVFGAALAVVVLAIDSVTLLRASARNLPIRGPGALMILHDFVALAAFGLLVGTAVAMRRRSDIHKRLMLLATLSILGPGINRIPLAFIKHGGIPVTLLLLDACVIAVIATDTFRNRRLHPAFAWGGSLLVAAMWLAYLGEQTLAWRHFGTWLVT